MASLSIQRWLSAMANSPASGIRKRESGDDPPLQELRRRLVLSTTRCVSSSGAREISSEATSAPKS